MKRVLVAGIGNIFLGDDAFGCEVVRELLQRPLPLDAQVTDFGIRSYDLAYALIEAYEEIILIDATSRGEPPGTTFLIEIDLNELPEGEIVAPDAHSLNPVHVLQMARALGGIRGKIYLVGCEPATLENENGDMGLSEEVRKAVPQALTMIESLLERKNYASTV